MPTSDGEPERTPVHRTAVRALIVTPDREVLLLRIRSPEGLLLWIAPGGGLERDESPEDALRRELEEEVGLVGCHIGPVVWRRRSTFNWGSWRVTQREDYRIVHAERFEPVMTDALEAEITEALRWWPLDELDAADHRIVPTSLADILSRYWAEGAPAEPPSEEVVIEA
jgi:8-oxo-dGTP pyrophosphatase MutT (NUDIX family)